MYLKCTPFGLLKTPFEILELAALIQTLGSETNSKKMFYFDMNSIESVPPQIRQVKNLFRLNLNDNKLETLPSDIFNMSTLQFLSVNNNFLSDNELKIIFIQFKILFKSKPKH